MSLSSGAPISWARLAISGRARTQRRLSAARPLFRKSTPTVKADAQVKLLHHGNSLETGSPEAFQTGSCRTNALGECRVMNLTPGGDYPLEASLPTRPLSSRSLPVRATLPSRSVSRSDLRSGVRGSPG
jgi:hypothetical protein